MKISAADLQYQNQNSVNFTGYRTLLGKRLDKVIEKGSISKDDNIFLVKELKKIINKRLTHSDNIGTGVQNIVYKLDDKYVLRVPISKMVQLEDKISLNSQKFSSLKTYYGEPVAMIGNVQILRNACQKEKAVPAGVPRHMLENYNETLVDAYYNEFYLPAFANVPQKSYDALVYDIKKLETMKSGDGNFYSFDYFNPNNIVLSGKTLRMTDEVEHTNLNNKNNISSIMNMLLKQMTVGTPAVPSTRLAKFRQEITKKIIKAGMKHNLPLTPDNKSNDVFNFVFKFLCQAKEDTKNVYTALEKIQTAKTPKERVIAADEYLNSIF